MILLIPLVISPLYQYSVIHPTCGFSIILI